MLASAKNRLFEKSRTLSSFPKTLWSFFRAVLASESTYSYFAVNLLVFLVVIGVLLAAVRLLQLRRQLDLDFAIVVAYAASAVNIIFSYSLNSPLYHVSGDPGAVSVFFAAGIFGLEGSFPMHLLLSVIFLLRARSTMRKKIGING